MSTLQARGLDMMRRYENTALELETVTLGIRAASDTWNNQTGVSAYRRVFSEEYSPAEGGLVMSNPIQFRLIRGTFTVGTIVSPGCKITDASNVEYIVAAGGARFVWPGDWVCSCEKAKG